MEAWKTGVGALSTAASWRARTESDIQTRELGAALGALLGGGDFVALDGDLGAGKTTFSAGVGEGLEVDEPLRSPSYLLCHEAEGRVPVLHLDAYFEQRLEGLLAEGLAGRFDRQTAVLVEWAERLGPWLPAEHLAVRIETLAETVRELVFSAHGARAEALLSSLQQSWISRGVS